MRAHGQGTAPHSANGSLPREMSAPLLLHELAVLGAIGKAWSAAAAAWPRMLIAAGRTVLDAQ